MERGHICRWRKVLSANAEARSALAYHDFSDPPPKKGLKTHQTCYRNELCTRKMSSPLIKNDNGCDYVNIKAPSLRHLNGIFTSTCLWVVQATEANTDWRLKVTGRASNSRRTKKIKKNKNSAKPSHQIHQDKLTKTQRRNQRIQKRGKSEQDNDAL